MLVVEDEVSYLFTNVSIISLSATEGGLGVKVECSIKKFYVIFYENNL